MGKKIFRRRFDRHATIRFSRNSAGAFGSRSPFVQRQPDVDRATPTSGIAVGKSRFSKPFSLTSGRDGISKLMESVGLEGSVLGFEAAGCAPNRWGDIGGQNFPAKIFGTGHRDFQRSTRSRIFSIARPRRLASSGMSLNKIEWGENKIIGVKFWVKMAFFGFFHFFDVSYLDNLWK